MTVKKSKIPSLAELIPDAGHREKIRAGLYSGKHLFGEDGVFTEMLQAIVNSCLEGEVISHIQEEKLSGKENRRNGLKTKTLRTESGPIEIKTPRDRAGSYEPLLVKPWERELNTGVNELVKRLYARGQSISDVRYQLKELYGLELSSGTISAITEQVWGTITTWQSRGLKSCYPIIYLDGIYFTVKEEGKFIKKVFYTVYGVDAEGKRDLLGMYMRPSESSTNWGMILEDLQSRGVEEVFFFCVDGLSGFSDAIRQVYPNAFVQRCIVHMIRNSVRFVSDKDIKRVCADLRLIYTASDLAAAQIALLAFKEKWDKKYPSISKKWEDNWTDLMAFMDFGKDIRRMVYTTNPVEALHRVIRKVTKSKGAWTNEKALLKQVFMALEYNEKSWKRSAHGWKSIQKELAQRFGERFLKHLN